jgi:selenocysteine-specific elongation factor
MRLVHVITTAGHVDHGKSTLIERLTGIDPDRLAEEKRRGMTIELGFAWCALPSGREIGIVDVPGHERFVPTMLAGAGSVDGVLFVVAANEGWKPQSEEHAQILDLLGARNAVVALTKSDLAADVAAVRAEVAARLAGTSLEGAEIVAISATTGAGLDELRAALDRALADEPENRGRARLYVDRVFSAKGSGTVVTGTLTGGVLRAGDDVVLMPSGRTARIRGIQSHKEQRSSAEPVARVALNLAGIDREHVARGDAVVHPGRWLATQTFDAEVRAVRELRHAVTSRAALKCYAGATEVDARISLFEGSGIDGGRTAFARVRLSAPIVAEPLDRFVLRDASRMRTVAGGRILDAHPSRARGPERIEQLALRARSDRDSMPSLLVAEAGAIRTDEIERRSGSGAPPRDAVVLASYAVSAERFASDAARIEAALASFHAREPLLPGMPREALRRAASFEDAALFEEMLAAMGSVVTDGPLARVATHRVELDPERTRAVLAQLRAAGMQPPSLAELEGAHGSDLVRAMRDAGLLIALDGGIVFGREQLEEAKERVAKAIANEGPLTAARIKTILETTRKFAIPLCEYFDRTGFTRRDGDLRTLRT